MPRRNSNAGANNSGHEPSASVLRVVYRDMPSVSQPSVDRELTKRFSEQLEASVKNMEAADG